MTTYADFLAQKTITASSCGVDVSGDELHPALFSFQRDAVQYWQPHKCPRDVASIRGRGTEGGNASMQTQDSSSRRIGRPPLDLLGRRFGRLLVLELCRTDAGDRVWRCRCDCGNETLATPGNLHKGNTASCGCLRLERLRAVVTKHGERHSRAYKIWLGIIQRCTNPNNPAWGNYGGRGITVHPDWLQFTNFLRDMGHPPDGTSVDRVDVNAEYSKSNCRWATNRQQTRNKRSNRSLTFQGKTQTLIEWSEELHIPYWTIHARLRRGWPTDQALTS